MSKTLLESVDDLLLKNEQQRKDLHQIRVLAQAAVQGIDISKGCSFAHCSEDVPRRLRHKIMCGSYHTRCRRRGSDQWIKLDSFIGQDGRLFEDTPPKSPPESRP